MATETSDGDEIQYKLSADFRSKNRVVIHQRRGGGWWGDKDTWKWVKDIGSGAFGTVSLEEEATTRQLRAVKKMYLASLKLDFRREIRTLIALRDHRDLFIPFLGWYQDNDFVYLAMEYAEYGDLEQYLSLYGPQSEAIAKEITKQLLKGLVVLHGKQICHRDLKTQNVLIVSTTPIHVKLADFGISKCAKGTKLDTRLGTPVYQAPELIGLLQTARRGPSLGYTNAVDIWALGCLLHKILTMKTPFLSTGIETECTSVDSYVDEPQTDLCLLSEYCLGKIDLPTEFLRSQASDTGIDFMRKCLAPDPGSRISSTDALTHQWMRLPLHFNQRNRSYVDFDDIWDYKNRLQTVEKCGQVEVRQATNSGAVNGEFTAVGNLVHQLIAALNNNAEYKDLLSTLLSLRLTLLELVGFGAFGPSLSNAIRFQLNKCTTLVEDFFLLSQEYTERMYPSEKERYHFRAEDAQKLHLALYDHDQALKMFPSIATEQCHYRPKRLNGGCHKATLEANTIAGQIGKQLAGFMELIWQPPQSLGYTWEGGYAEYEAPILFEDALGRHIAIPLELCDTLNSFHGVLNIMFQNTPGQLRVAQKEYEVMNESGDGSIIQEEDWKLQVVPGGRIAMNILLRSKKLELETDTHICPKCRTSNDEIEPVRGILHCLHCQLAFRVTKQERIVELLDSEDDILDLPPKDAEGVKPTVQGLGAQKKPQPEEDSFRRVHYLYEVLKRQEDNRPADTKNSGEDTPLRPPRGISYSSRNDNPYRGTTGGLNLSYSSPRTQASYYSNHNPYRHTTGGLNISHSPPRPQIIVPVEPPSPTESECSSCGSSVPLNTPWSSNSSNQYLQTEHVCSRRSTHSKDCLPPIISRDHHVSTSAFSEPLIGHQAYGNDRSSRFIVSAASTEHHRSRSRNRHTKYHYNTKQPDEEFQGRGSDVGHRGRTRFPRNLVNKEAIEEMGLPWTEEHNGSLIVLRALDRTEIERLVDLAMVIRRGKTRAADVPILIETGQVSAN